MTLMPLGSAGVASDPRGAVSRTFVIGAMFAIILGVPVPLLGQSQLAAFHTMVGAWAVDISSTPDPDGDTRYLFTATIPGGPSKQLALDRRNRSIESVAISTGGVFVVIGQSSVGKLVNTIPNDTRPPDVVLCYAPILSADGRFISYEEFYPANDDVGASVYLVYDTTLTPLQNRMTSSTESAGVDIGWAVYPNANRTSQSYDTSIFSKATRHQPLSRLTWVSSTKLAFVDYALAKATFVLVDVSGGALSAVPQEYELDETQFVDPSKGDPRNPAARYLVADRIMNGSNPNEYVIALHSDRALLVSTITVQF